VLLHDADLDRTTSGSGPVRDHDVETVTALEARGWFDGSAAAGNSVRVAAPRLSELLALLTAGRRVLLEIKGEHNADQIDAVVRACRASAHETKVFLQSFEVATLGLLRALEPRATFGLLVDGFYDDPVGRCRDVGAVACNPDCRAVLDRPAMVRVLHAAGLSVSVWTADDPADWAALTGTGVDGIITNTPRSCCDGSGAQRRAEHLTPFDPTACRRSASQRLTDDRVHG
jgi:glycerophosphoryl diester phosphodiesterase